MSRKLFLRCILVDKLIILFWKENLVHSMVPSYFTLFPKAVVSNDKPLIQKSFKTKGIGKTFGFLFYGLLATSKKVALTMHWWVEIKQQGNLSAAACRQNPWANRAEQASVQLIIVTNRNLIDRLNIIKSINYYFLQFFISLNLYFWCWSQWSWKLLLIKTCCNVQEVKTHSTNP